MKPTPKCCVTFICQSGELELKALLLASSLRLNNPDNKVELVAAIPDPVVWGELSDPCKLLLLQLNVRQQVVPSPWGEAYPIGNKIAAMGVPTQAPVTLLLDSDILCLRSFDYADFVSQELAAKPADFNTFKDLGAQWQLAYEQFNLARPEQRVMSTVGQEIIWPYFNAGVVAVKNGPEFSEIWLQTACDIDANTAIENKRPWLDQISLPIAAARCGYNFQALDDQYNYPAHVKPLSQAGSQLPALCHYHWPSIIEQEPVLVSLVAELVKAHPVLTDLMQQYPEWQLRHCPYPQRKAAGRFFWRARKHNSKLRNDFIITGLPRSGTSMLCHVLSRVPNMVVINEPKEVHPALSAVTGNHNLAVYYRKIRADIIYGQPIENKVTESGQLIEDTRIEDVRRLYQPDISSADFHLGTKNPLVYLTRLRWLCDTYPHMPKIATIRHPYDTIASWKKSFEHLATVNHNAFTLGGAADPLIDAYQRERIEKIVAQPSEVIRRALLWSYLADMLWRDRDKVHVVKYEDLTSSPLQSLSEILEALSVKARPGPLAAPIRESRVGSELDLQDKLVVQQLCTSSMAKWGYQP
jgi:hypothetical protein